MKLKKIASLMLAGVMAISMLTACGDKGSSSSSSEVPETNDLVSKVVAELDEDITKKVTFTADSSLQDTLNEMIAYYGYQNSMSNFKKENLVKFDTDLKDDELAPLDTTVVSKDDDKQTTTVVAVVKTSDSNDTYVAKKIAAAIEDQYVMTGAIKLAGLPVKGNDVKSSSTASAADCYYTFEYTGNMAVQSVDDSLGNVTGYVVAFTVTRTPAKHDL
ncbi:hypothetical protein [Faecalibacterium sp. An192]|uniref:hypothetical protein n=1 Tax=Faecalibacterium sp. An192 TaxID=1965581 RepID=UPI000B3A7539|nr:hypothetical protein [Faecalibacterium sp. An192]OUP27573.1 hypothetical protein B5F27_09405 [Faecalibacterium sp. An192]